MGIVRTDITLKNAFDTLACKRGIIEEQDIHQTTVEAMVDTGAMTLVINETLRQTLGLGIKRELQATLANDTKETVKLTEPVEVHWKDRNMICEPLVISGEGEILLGAIPLEGMDLMVDPVRGELTGAHGDEIVGILK